MQIALFGLGRMGARIARRLHKAGFEVLAWNRSEPARREFERFVQNSRIDDERPGQKSRTFDGIGSLADGLTDGVRIFWLMLPHEIVDEFLHSRLEPYLRSGDIVIDGGNSFYKDSARRAKEAANRGVIFFDCGVSGGVWGEENGFALMVGGSASVWPKIEPIFKALSSGNNYGLLGQAGAGHFVKMAHNGIEYGMMEAIAEGYGIMKESGLNLDLLQVTKIFQQAAVVRSWLVDLVGQILEKENLKATKGEIGMRGEGEWAVRAAKELGVDARVIKDAVEVRKESRNPKNQQKYSNKIVALLRKQFGGHAVKE